MPYFMYMIYKYIYTPEICISNSNGYAGREHGISKNRERIENIWLVNLQSGERSNSFLRRVESTNVTIYSYIRGHVHVHIYRHKYTTTYTDTRMIFE